MNTQTTKIEFKGDVLQSVADMLKAAGFKVFVSIYSYQQGENIKHTYFHFTDGVNIGYCENAPYFNGVRFSTVHKPCRECGTGFGLYNSTDGVFNPTIEEAKKAFIFAPKWATHKECAAVKKYKSWEDFTQRSNGPNEYVEY